MITFFEKSPLFKLLTALALSSSFFELTNASKNPVVFLLLSMITFLSLDKSLLQWKNKAIKEKKIILFFSILLTITTFLGGKVIVTGGFYTGSYSENYFTSVTIWDFIWSGFFLFFSLEAAICLLAFYEKLTSCKKYTLPSLFASEKKLFFLSWTFIFLCWLPYLITYYPGAIYGDSQSSIKQALGELLITNHHPVMYTLLIKFFLSIGRFFADTSFGCALYTVFQMLLISGIFAYFLLWLRRKHCPDIFLIFTCCFYALSPIFPLHAISMWKDPIFSAFILLLSLVSYDIVNTKGKLLENTKHIALLCLLSLVICFIRNNGIYVMIVYWITLGIYYGIVKKHYIKKGKFLFSFLGCFVFYMIITGPLYSKLDITSEFVESLSIPLQQMSSVVVYDGKMTETQREYMFRLLPEEDYLESYTPCCVDNIKWHPNFNEDFLENNKSGFFKTWAQMLIPNIKLYVKAYICQTFEYWSLSDIKRNSFVDKINTLQYSDEVPATDYSEILFSSSWKEHFPFSYIFLSEGLVTWIMFFSIMQILLANKKEKIIPLLPLLTAWGTLLISVPLAAWQRYTLSSTFALPLFLSLYAITQWESPKK